MSKKKLTKNQQAFKSQINRLKRAYRTQENKGYRFDRKLKDIVNLEMPKRVTKKLLESLKAVTPAVLRKFTTALSSSGKVESGTLVFKERKKESAEKAQRTRKIKKDKLKNPMNDKFVEKQRIKDLQDKIKHYQINQGDIIFQRVIELINEYPTKGARYLRKLLDNEINRFGYEAVIRAIAQAPEKMVKMAQDMVYYEKTKESIHQAFINFHEIITGTIPTLDERKTIEEMLEEIGDLPEFNMQ